MIGDKAVSFNQSLNYIYEHLSYGTLDDGIACWDLLSGFTAE